MPIVERWNRTFQSDLERYLTAETESRGRVYKRWIDALPLLTRNMNNRFNRSIGMKPVEVNDNNVEIVRKRLDTEEDTVKCRFKLGDTVRIPISKAMFEKGYTQSKRFELRL